MDTSNIQYDSKELKLQLLSHPSYPSLHALTGVLNHFGIDNAAVEVPVEDSVLEHLPKAFIAQLDLEAYGKTMALVLKSDSTYQVVISEKSKISLSESEFKQSFSGILLMAESSESNIVEKSKRNSVNVVLATIATLSFIGHLLYHDISLISLFYMLLSVIGVIISFTIFKQEQGEETMLGNAFCNAGKEVTDCNSVLNSNGARLFGNLKLSDLCMIYFSGLFLSTYILSVISYDISVLMMVSILALPVTLYSIYYQKFKIKKWCMLCLTVVGILWLQSSIVLFKMIDMTTVSLSALSIIIFAFLTSYLIWQFVSYLLKSRRLLYDLKVDYLKFKKNYTLFNSRLQASERKPIEPNLAPEILLGNKDASLDITIITNPFCGHCKEAHAVVEKILDAHSDKVKVRIRFNINTDDESSTLMKITTRLTDMFNNADIDGCMQAMHDIYGGMHQDEWFEKWGVATDFNSASKVINLQRDWCTTNGINFTPVILVNGAVYPNEYKRTDLLYFIEELEEESQNNTYELQGQLL